MKMTRAAKISVPIKISGAIPNKTPKLVDTPRPPLNFRKIEYMCPKIVARPVRIITQGRSVIC